MGGWDLLCTRSHPSSHSNIDSSFHFPHSSPHPTGVIELRSPSVNTYATSCNLPGRHGKCSRKHRRGNDCKKVYNSTPCSLKDLFTSSQFVISSLLKNINILSKPFPMYCSKFVSNGERVQIIKMRVSLDVKQTRNGRSPGSRRKLQQEKSFYLLKQCFPTKPALKVI